MEDVSVDFEATASDVPVPPGSHLQRLPLEAMDPKLTSIQPGGGLCMRLELGWGRCRRWYLKTFRRRYLQRMLALRRGDAANCPQEILDPRDLKFVRNQTQCYWAPEDDPFAWRDRLPFAREGLAEVVVGSGVLVALSAGLAMVYWPAALVPGVLVAFVWWFFRNPRRVVPMEPGLVVAPADGRVVAIEETPYDEFLQGPAVTIGIFLSVLDVHVNRAPVAARVIGLTYRPGKFLNALRPASARENEQLAIRLEETQEPFRRMVVRQIAGAIARRIVCWLKPGDELARGERFGMIKLGSRTELVLPRQPGLCLEVRLGQKVKAGTSVLARYPAGIGE